MEMRDYLTDAAKALQIKLTEEQLDRFDIYFRLLVEWNEKINLTAITDPQGVAVKHFADSLSLLSKLDIPENARVIDVGTGAGFPGIVLKIVRPDIELTLLDSLKKRFLFINELLNKLGLAAECIAGRAEEYGQDLEMRECFDLCVSRAVARLNILSEYCLPFVRLSGKFVAFKGGGSDEEIQNSKKAIQTLGGKLIKIHSFELPFDGGARKLVEIEKIRPTPDNYPRNNGRIKSKPL